MSSTRKAKDATVFHQCRYASSPGLEYGLIANLVAKRVTTLDNSADRELVWAIQAWSHLPGGLVAVAADIVAKFPHYLGTPSMVASGKTNGEYSADEVRSIRREMPADVREEFTLHGEIPAAISSRCNSRILLADRARQYLENNCGSYSSASQAKRDINLGAGATEELTAAADAALRQPKTYPVQTFFDICRHATGADDRDTKFQNLEREIASLCLDPAGDLSSGPWYFSRLIDALREYQKIWIQKKSQMPASALCRVVYDNLDYALSSGVLTLMTGNSITGKRFAARHWCEIHPGHARHCEVPPANDEAAFYRAIATALGLGNFQNYKNVQIRERVEKILQAGDLLLVLSESQRLWPQKNLREAFPSRLLWVLTQVDSGAKICMISSPQFFMAQRACEKTGWDSPELKSRIGNMVTLPEKLDVTDLVAIARVVMPAATDDILESVAIYAVASERYLTAVESIALRAQHIAQKDGRESYASKDIVAAMKFVGNSDTLLRNPLAEPKKVIPAPSDSEMNPEPAAPIARSREVRPVQSFHRRSGDVELVKA